MQTCHDVHMYVGTGLLRIAHHDGSCLQLKLHASQQSAVQQLSSHNTNYWNSRITLVLLEQVHTCIYWPL